LSIVLVKIALRFYKPHPNHIKIVQQSSLLKDLDLVFLFRFDRGQITQNQPLCFASGSFPCFEAHCHLFVQITIWEQYVTFLGKWVWGLGYEMGVMLRYEVGTEQDIRVELQIF